MPDLPHWHCSNCGHNWLQRKPQTPVKCAACQRRYDIALVIPESLLNERKSA